MYPSPEQEADKNAASAYSYAGPSPYSRECAGENTPSAFDYTPSYASNAPAPAELRAGPPRPRCGARALGGPARGTG